MKTKISIFLLASAFVWLTACEIPVADANLSGDWITLSGDTLELRSGSYTRTLVSGGGSVIERGSYTVNGNTIVFSQSNSHVVERFNFELDFPTLLVGTVLYYANVAVEPPSIVGQWDLDITSGTQIYLFDETRPVPGRAGFHEGRYKRVDRVIGTYVINSNRTPGQSFLNLVPSHLHGGWLRFILLRLDGNGVDNIFEHVFERLLPMPDEPPLPIAWGYIWDTWYIEIHEIMAAFNEARSLAQTIGQQQHLESFLTSIMEFGREETFRYEILTDEFLVYRGHNFAEIDNILIFEVGSGSSASQLRYNKAARPLPWTQDKYIETDE